MHEYQKRLLAASDFLMRFPGLSDIDCRHDDWCGIYKKRGKRECNCDPYIVVRIPNGQLFRIYEHGRIEQIILV